MAIIDLGMFEQAATRSPGRPKGSTRETRLSPRAKIALRAVAMGMRQKRAAAVAGLESSGSYVSQLKQSPQGQAFICKMEDAIDTKVLDTTQWIEQLGREALGRLAQMMRFSPNEQIQFKAAQDLADRAPATSKVQRHQVESFTLSGRDAKELAAAMTEAASLREDFADAIKGNYIRVPLEERLLAGPTDPAPAHSPSMREEAGPQDEPPTSPSTVPT